MRNAQMKGINWHDIRRFLNQRSPTGVRRFQWSKEVPSNSRQYVRYLLLVKARKAVNKRNPKMPRCERRSLADAYAKGEWRRLIAQTANL